MDRKVKELEEQAKQELVEEHDEVIVRRLKRRLSSINDAKKSLKVAEKAFDDSGLHTDEDNVKSTEARITKLEEDYDKFVEQNIKQVA